MASPLHLLLVALQLVLLHHAHGGAYYGHKAQQHQPVPQLPHMAHGKEGLPQQYLVKELPHFQYAKEIPMIPQYRKDYMHLPMHGKGKDMTRKEDRGQTRGANLVVQTSWCKPRGANLVVQTSWCHTNRAHV